MKCSGKLHAETLTPVRTAIQRTAVRLIFITHMQQFVIDETAVRSTSDYPHLLEAGYSSAALPSVGFGDICRDGFDHTRVISIDTYRHYAC